MADVTRPVGFVQDYRTRDYPDTAAPDHRNVASRRRLLGVGFVEGTWFDEPQPDGTIATLVGHSLDVASVLG